MNVWFFNSEMKKVFWFLFASDPDPYIIKHKKSEAPFFLLFCDFFTNPEPNPLSDPRIRIRTKMSQIRNTAKIFN